MPIFDPANLRPYSGSSDLSGILQFAGECNLLTDFCCSLLPGDVSHFLSNGLVGRDPTSYCFLYETNSGIEALILFYAIRSSAWQMLVHPQRRDAEAGLVEWAEQHLRQLLSANGSAKE